MNKKIAIPRGTRDILPSEVTAWQQIEEKARKLLEIYNYSEIRTPAFEETSLFARSLGQTTDIVQKQMLNLEKDGLSLRPEGTASIVRSYIENNMDKKQALTKLYYIGPMFRGERPQKGRLRQFYQIGVEAIGPDACSDYSPYLDAEIVALSVNLLKTFGLNDFQLKINTLGTINCKENFYNLMKKKLKSYKSDLCNECQKRFEQNIFRILDCKNNACKSIVKQIGFGPASEWLSQESRDYFSEVQKALGILNIKYDVDPSLVRGLDYYTNTVFEISSPSLGSQDALGAGGRYNDLVGQLGGPSVGATGFAFGIERILLAMPRTLEGWEKKLQVYVIVLDKSCLNKAFEILTILRSQDIYSDINYGAGSIKKQMRAADRSNARYVLIIGEDEIKSDKISMKDMGSGEQEKIPFNKIVEILKNKL